MGPERNRRFGAAAVAVITLLVEATAVAGCGGDSAAVKNPAPYKLTPTDDGLNIVVLTPVALERLMIETAPVTEQTLNGTVYTTVPYAALIYDNDGGTWVYLNPEPLTYVRAAVTVERIEGDTVYLSDGPKPGSQVAVTSVAELYGTDTGVGK